VESIESNAQQRPEHMLKGNRDDMLSLSISL